MVDDFMSARISRVTKVVRPRAKVGAALTPPNDQASTKNKTKSKTKAKTTGAPPPSSSQSTTLSMSTISRQVAELGKSGLTGAARDAADREAARRSGIKLRPAKPASVRQQVEAKREARHAAEVRSAELAEDGFMISPEALLAESARRTAKPGHVRALDRKFRDKSGLGRFGTRGVHLQTGRAEAGGLVLSSKNLADIAKAGQARVRPNFGSLRGGDSVHRGGVSKSKGRGKGRGGKRR
mmetsp:Transcript_12054/g.38274  ORF Transcript_12054/g.38274 Transcript_12054/m.38274 type:complete len:239 (-) Transcript_12054:554-1270(-)